jgi:hypothetical protein
MNTNPLQESAIILHGVGIGPVTRGMVRERAVELAVINGRLAHEATKLDLEEARRELTGSAALDPQQKLLESVPESERWEPVLVSTGHEALTFFDDGEDDEGRSASERLFEEGVEEAEHDQMLQAATARTEAS